MPPILTKLPFELLANICYFVEAEDLRNLSLTCKCFYQLILSDFLWEKLATNKYHLTADSFGTVPAKKFYQCLLHHYGKMLGFWFLDDMTQYGGLLQVVVKDGAIIGQELVSPSANEDFLQPLTKRNIFRMSFDANMELRLSCMMGSETPGMSCAQEGMLSIGLQRGRSAKYSVDCINGHPNPRVDRMAGTEYEVERLKICCLDEQSHISALIRKHGFGIKQDHFNGDENETIAWNRGDRRFLLDLQNVTCNFDLEFERLSIPEQSFSPCILQPGLFKGTYGGHGVELVMVSGDMDHIEGTKVTGDPNIPMRQVTFKSNLREPLAPSKSEQMSLHALSSIPISQELAQMKLTEMPTQMFYAPHGITIDASEFVFPRNCRGRFNAECQLAYHNYQNPSFAKSQFIVFSEDILGLIIFNLRDLMLFHRVKLDTPTS